VEEILVWLFEGEVRLVLIGAVLALFIVKWIIEAVRGVVLAFHETRRAPAGKGSGRTA
jgi:hypothetical protein